MDKALTSNKTKINEALIPIINENDPYPQITPGLSRCNSVGLAARQSGYNSATTGYSSSFPSGRETGLEGPVPFTR